MRPESHTDFDPLLTGQHESRPQQNHADESVQRRLAGEVADIVARFPVPGLPAA